MDKSVIEQFRSKLKNAGIEDFNLRIEGGNKVITHNANSKIYLQPDYVLAIETRNNYGGKPKANFNLVACPYDTVDNAKAFDVTTKQLIDFLAADGISLDDELKEFIAKHGGRVSIEQRTTSGYYGEIHNEKGEVVLTTPLPGRVTQALTNDKEGKVTVDPESPIV